MISNKMSVSAAYTTCSFFQVCCCTGTVDNALYSGEQDKYKVDKINTRQGWSLSYREVDRHGVNLRWGDKAEL